MRTNETNGQFVTDPSKALVNENYSYRLRIRTGANPVGSIVFYDTIETMVDGSGNDVTAGWKGRLVGFDTSRAVSLVFDPVIYYSESLTPRSLFTHPGDWTVYQDGVTDRTKVKTVAFDLRYDVSNNEKKLDPNTVLYVDINLKAPAAAQSTNAENEFSLEWQLMNAAGNPTGSITGLDSNRVEVEVDGIAVIPNVDLNLNIVDETRNPITSGRAGNRTDR